MSLVAGAGDVTKVIVVGDHETYISTTTAVVWKTLCSLIRKRDSFVLVHRHLGSRGTMHDFGSKMGIMHRRKWNSKVYSPCA